MGDGMGILSVDHRRFLSRTVTVIAALSTVLVLALSYIPSMTVNESAKGAASDIQHRMRALALTPHSPILINGNADFVSANGVTGGTGTESDPYVIEGWDISVNSGNGIDIFSTDAYFVIQNVSVHNTGTYNSWGIYLSGLSNGTVTDSTVSGHYVGIDVWSSSRITISNNTVFNRNNSGIAIFDCVNASVLHNSISSTEASWRGVSVYWCDRVNVSYNKISDIRNDLRLGFGIDSWESNNCTFDGNEVSYCDAGIFVSSSYDFRIFHNTLVNNTMQGFDDGERNLWDLGYPGGGNYWSNYSGVDLFRGQDQNISGADRIGDEPYVRDEFRITQSHVVDNYPLMEPYLGSLRPIAGFDFAPHTGDPTTNFEFDASSCFDADDALSSLEVRWDWQGDGIWDTGWSYEKTAQWQYSSAGTYTVRLEVTDGQGMTNTTTANVVVSDAAIPEFGTALVPVLAFAAVFIMLVRSRLRIG